MEGHTHIIVRQEARVHVPPGTIFLVLSKWILTKLPECFPKLVGMLVMFLFSHVIFA